MFKKYQIGGISYEVDDEKLCWRYEGDTPKRVFFFLSEPIIPSGLVWAGAKELLPPDVLIKEISKHEGRLISPIKEVCDEFQVWHHEQVLSLLSIKDILNDCLSDGIFNIAPICWLLKSTPEECKKVLGKALWKKLCKNTLKDNLAAVDRFPWTEEGGQGSYVKMLGLYSKVTSRVVLSRYSLAMYLVELEVRLWVQSNIGRERTMVKDTINMATKLSLPFSFKWSAKRMRREHDSYAKKLAAKDYSKENFKSLEDYNNILLPKFVDKTTGVEYSAVILKSPYEMKMESVAMHHCVVDYCDKVEGDDYVVLSLMKDGEKYSTLGCTEDWVLWGDGRVGHCGFVTDQHYTHCNEPVDDDNITKLEEMVLEALNQITTMKKVA